MAEDLRRLFEQGGDDTPVLTRRVAWGLAGTVTKNSTWQTIVTWLQGVLNFLKPSNNLSDVTDAATALSNLGGIGAGALNGYALKSNVLELNNTVEFTPDNPYEPATSKYVLDRTESIHIYQSGISSTYGTADVMWSKAGKVVSIYGKFNSLYGADSAPEGTVFASIPFSTQFEAGIQPECCAYGRHDRSCAILIDAVGNLRFRGNTDSIIYSFNLTYIEP